MADPVAAAVHGPTVRWTPSLSVVASADIHPPHATDRPAFTHRIANLFAARPRGVRRRADRRCPCLRSALTANIRQRSDPLSAVAMRRGPVVEPPWRRQQRRRRSSSWLLLPPRSRRLGKSRTYCRREGRQPASTSSKAPPSQQPTTPTGSHMDIDAESFWTVTVPSSQLFTRSPNGTGGIPPGSMIKPPPICRKVMTIATGSCSTIRPFGWPRPHRRRCWPLKIMSARPADIPDVRLLVGILGYSTPDQVRDTAASVFPGERLSERSEAAITRLFGEQ